MDILLINMNKFIKYALVFSTSFGWSQNILGQIIFNSTPTENADLNDDGNGNILDIIFMVNLILS